MKESQTEELILNTARNVFFKKGNIHATTQDIANEAGINRALIHYYFRSRDLLVEKMMREAHKTTVHKIDSIFASDVPFRNKIEKFIDVFIDQALEYPYLESFIITEINRPENKYLQVFSKNFLENFIQKFNPELLEEMKKGTIPFSSPLEFIINLMALCSYPIAARPIIQLLFNMENSQYEKFMKERKKQIHKLIFG